MLDRDVILVREGVAVHSARRGLHHRRALWSSDSESATGILSIDLSVHSVGGRLQLHHRGEGGRSGSSSITVERGFVGVDATVRGKTYRFVNTHLERVQPDPPIRTAIIQYLQSLELVETLQATTPDDRPLILVGDFNSSPEDASDQSRYNPAVPYQIIVDAGLRGHLGHEPS